MRPRKTFLKVAAFIPAIILVGAFVGCRSGAFQRSPKPEPLPEPHPLGFNGPAPPAPPPPADAKPVFMGGAKSMMIATPRPPGAPLFPPADPPKPAPTSSMP